MCVLGGGEFSGSRCDVASSWCLACLCFLQLMVYREFFMDAMQMVVAIPLCFGSFVHHLWLALLCNSYKHRRILGRCYNKCLWGKARMGSAYHFNLLMCFLALHIGTRRLPVISFWVYPLYTPKDESRGNCILVCQACVPLLSLLLPAAAAWLGFLFCSTAESSWV